MSNTIVNSNFVIVNDSGTNDSILSKYYGKARIETNHIIEVQSDPADFDANNVQDMPLMGESCVANEFYNYSGVVYVCIQSHNRTEHPPGDIPALFRIYREQGLPWAQPLSTNPYHLNDWVTHTGEEWISIIDNNVWEPGTVGTENLWTLRNEI